ncbi:hypothetical protein PQY74_02255 [Nitrosopumilus sp.]|nr:hypothetical protein [Nitrosopumilus sp.]
MRTRKYFTVKEWQRFNTNNYSDMQELLCQKFDVILLDYRTKKQKVFSLLQKINLKNIDTGVSEFSKLVQSFGNSMDQFTAEINNGKVSDRKNLESVWGTSKKQTPIWSDNDSDNLEKIWGKRNE